MKARTSGLKYFIKVLCNLAGGCKALFLFFRVTKEVSKDSKEAQQFLKASAEPSNSQKRPQTGERFKKKL